MSSQNPLSILPRLKDETAWRQDKVVILVLILVVSGLSSLVIAGAMSLSPTIVTAFLSSVGTIGTIAVGIVGGNSVARKGIYAIAANRAVAAESADGNGTSPTPQPIAASVKS